MTHYNFYSPKGGVGVSTTAAAFARSLEGRTLLTSHEGINDLCALTGVPTPVEFVEVTPNLTIGVPEMETADGFRFDHVITDGKELIDDTNVINVLVVRNCYLSIRKASATVRDDGKPERVVLVREEGRALDGKDVADVLDVPYDELVVINIDPAIARAVDAGLLVRHAPRHLARSMEKIGA